MGGGGGFSFPLSAPCAKRLHRCQMHVIVVVVIVLEVPTVFIDRLATLVSIISIYLDISLALDLVPPPILIYLLLPAPYSFDIDLKIDFDLDPVPIPGLDRHHILDCP